MTRLEIEQCNDIDVLKQLCIAQRSQLAYVGEVLIDESKWHIKPDRAIEMIREYLVRHQYELEFKDSYTEEE